MTSRPDARPAPAGTATRRRLRGPFSRWPRAADATLAAAVLVANVVTEDTAQDNFALRGVGEVPVPALVLIVVAAVALYWRRQRPLPVLAVALAASALALPYAEGPVGALLFALYSAGRHGPEVGWNAAGLVAAMGVTALGGGVDDWPLGETIFSVFVMDLVWYVGRRLRTRGERGAQLRRQQEAEAQQALADERTRIARELHDVVAHRVSLMTVQAGAAKTVIADDPEGAHRAMEAVEQAGRQALGELRHLLGVLRPEGDAGRGPQPGLQDLPRLVEQFGAAGLEVALDVDGQHDDLPARVDLSAYRIVQESLTNVLKHGGAGARARVRADVDAAAVTLEVVDDGRGASRLPASGHGIAGMRERVALLGGRLDAGPRRGGGFRVVAWLPIDQERA